MQKVGIKYCGGCNPYYDRVALVKELESRLKGKVEFVSAADDDIDFLLAVEGCGTDCADLSLFVDINIRVITQREDADKFIQEISG